MTHKNAADLQPSDIRKRLPNDLPPAEEEVDALVCLCGHDITDEISDTTKVVKLIHVDADDHDWVTADDRSELSFNWDVVGWMRSCDYEDEGQNREGYTDDQDRENYT